jgi:hypothetical protein
MLEETVKSELSAGVLLAANAGKKEKEKKTAGKKGRMQPHDHGHILKEIAAARKQKRLIRSLLQIRGRGT